jgi:hypothetical protein
VLIACFQLSILAISAILAIRRSLIAQTHFSPTGVKAFKKAQGVRFTDKAGKSTADCYQPVAYSAFRVQAFPGLPADAALGPAHTKYQRKPSRSQ